MTLPHVPVSMNVITKDNVKNTIAAIDSALGALDPERLGLDEIVVVDTGSTPENLTKLREALGDFPNATLIPVDLARPYEPLIAKYLPPKFLDQFRQMCAEGTAQASGLLDFAEPRRIAFDSSTHDVIFWIDTDDLLVEPVPGKLRQAVNTVFSEHAQEARNIGVLMLDYAYTFAPDGAETTALRRERFVRKRDFHWVGVCHETLIPNERPGTDPGEVAYFADLGSKISHAHNDKPTGFADIRNFVCLAREIERQEDAGQFVDPRLIYYLGNAARGLRLTDTALTLYRQFDRVSGSEDDRFNAHYHRASICLDDDVARPFDAYDALLECVKIKPIDPRGYFGLQRVCMRLQRWEESLHWYEVGQRYRMPPNQIMSYDPTHVDYFPHFFACGAAQELGDFDLMLSCARKAHDLRPELKESKDLLRNALGRAEAHKVAEGVRLLTQYSKDQDPRVPLALLASVPPDLERVGLAAKEEGPRSGKPEIAIWCGPSGEPWGPQSRHSGIGGSEKMAIILGEAIQRTGRADVSVYADVPHDQRGITNGVRWEHWAAFDTERPRHAIIFWRCPAAVDSIKTPTRTRVIWNHDVQNPAQYPPARLSRIDYVQCQSDFHMKPLEEIVPEEKQWVARNAIEPPIARVGDRDPKQVLYCSSPDRGLLTAARIVARAQKIDPEISFVVTYGVTLWARKAFAQRNHRFCPDVGHEISMDLYERDVHAALDAVGATNLNRVNWADMEGLMQSSGVWLYPTRFPEISCMSAMEALANGCHPVATRFGALAETLGDAGTVLPPLPEKGDPSEEWLSQAAQMLVDACNKNFDRDAQAAAAIARFNVDDLAEQWLDKLGLGEGTQAADSPTQVDSVRSSPAQSKGDSNGTHPGSSRDAETPRTPACARREDSAEARTGKGSRAGAENRPKSPAKV